MADSLALGLKYVRKLLVIISVLIVGFVSLWPLPHGQHVSALGDEQAKAYQKGVLYYDVDNSTVGCTFAGDSSGSPITTTLPATIPSGYATLFNQAAAAYKTNPQFIA